MVDEDVDCARLPRTPWPLREPDTIFHKWPKRLCAASMKALRAFWAAAIFFWLSDTILFWAAVS